MLQYTDPLSSAPLRIDQSQRNEGLTNKVRHACAYLGARGRVVQKGIGEPHLFLLTRASWAEPTGSVYSGGLQGCVLATVTNSCFSHWPVINQWPIQPKCIPYSVRHNIWTLCGVFWVSITIRVIGQWLTNGQFNRNIYWIWHQNVVMV